MNGRAWTRRELAELRRRYPKERTAAIAQTLGRPFSGVCSKANEIGLRKRRPRPWTVAEIRVLRREYADAPAKKIARALDRDVHQVYNQAQRLGLKKADDFNRRQVLARFARGWRPSGKPWTKRQLALLRKLYPHRPTPEVAKRCGHSLSSTHKTAADMGLRKSAEYLASPDACRLRRGDNVGAAYRFKPGHVPANKGLRRPGWGPGRMKETQFKKGQKCHNWVPIGSTTYSKEGYFKRKISDTGYPPRDWKHEHVLIWERHYGPVPPGYAVKFIDGDKRNVTLNNLCLVSRADLARLNSMWNRYPRELAEVIQLRGALNRKINRRLRHEEQDRGSAQSPVRDARGAAG